VAVLQFAVADAGLTARRRSRSAGARPGPSGASPADAVLSLQRQVGNRAVTALLDRRKVVQRTCGCVGAGPCRCPTGDGDDRDGARTRPVVQRFGSDEHVRIGDEALPGRTVLVTGYGRMTHGEMIALGDFFGSLREIESLAAMGQWGKAQIDFALWKVNPRTGANATGRPNPGDATAEEAVMARYYRLAGRNQTHFSTGSAPGLSNREQYLEGHTAALRAAWFEGLSPLTVRPSNWQAQEAFAGHFLTDAFSAGHVRTPRGDIQRHWEALYPGFRQNLVRLIACHMAAYINERDNVGYVQTVGQLTDGIAERVAAQGGAKLSAFSIGDLISKVMHDADNAGLDVVSAQAPPGVGTVGADGRVHWRAVGDDHLFPSAANPAAAQTRQMVEEAVRRSYTEGEAAYRAGMTGGATLSSLTDPTRFSALGLLPQADAASTTNPTYDWRQPSIASLPASITTLLRAQFDPGHEVRDGLDSIPIPATTDVAGGVFTLHTGDAWNCFRGLLLADPLRTIIRIGNGDLCPPNNDNPCPVR
jgi:hypothetical protein